MRRSRGSGRNVRTRRTACLTPLVLALWLPAAPGLAGPTDEALSTLVSGLPSVTPNGRAIGEVAFLGTALDQRPVERAKQFLLPVALDLPLLHAHLEVALAERFDLAQAFVPPEIGAEVETLRGFSDDRKILSDVNRALDVDAVVVARARLEPGLPGGIRVELQLLAGRTEPGAFVQRSERSLPQGLTTLGRWNTPVLAGLAALALFLIRPLLRGSGSIEVHIPAPPGESDDAAKGNGGGKFRFNRAVTSIHLRPRNAKAGGRVPDAFNRGMVGARTKLEKIPPGAYRIEVRRVFRDPDSSEVTCIQTEEKTLSVQRGRTVRVQFELSDVEIPIEVKVVDGEQPIEDGKAMAGLKGATESARYVRGGATQLAAPRGEQHVLLGYRDRVYQRKVKLESASKRTTVAFDVSKREGLLFDACEPAVLPFVQGDREGAIQALESAGQQQKADLLRAELFQDKGRTSEAAEALEAAGQLREAAELAAQSGDSAHAATLFEQAGDLARAAELYKSAGDLDAAIRAYERGKDYDGAIACAFQSGSRSKAVELMEKKGAHFDAARMALELHDMELGIRLLQRVSLHDPNYGEACITLTQLLAERGEPELAIQKLDEAVDVFGADNFLELREQVANLLEEKGLHQAALEAFETIRKRDIDYPGVAEKIEELRELVRGRGDATVVGSVATADNASTAPLEGRYEIQGELGRGAMGIVYKAKDRRLGRTVALKRLPDNLKEHPTAVRLFLREARAAAALNHGNIVTLFDADQESGVYYLTMEFLDGMPVDAILEKRGRLSVRDTLRLAAQTATGLAYAHSERIVHRDIKPSNLFYTKKRQLKIMDFGLAKMVEEVRRAASVIGGTPYYMAPEQAVGEFIDHRADQYAFGVTVFQLVTGRVPFDSGDMTYHHLNTPPPDPRAFADDLPDDLAELILRLMAKPPEERFERTDEVEERLETMLRRAEAEAA